jgi:hypothetical protein
MRRCVKQGPPVPSPANVDYLLPQAGRRADERVPDVLTWLQVKGSYSLAKNVLDVAQVALLVNVAKEGRRVSRSVLKELATLVG